MLSSRLCVIAALLCLNATYSPAAAPPRVLQPVARLRSASVISLFAFNPDGSSCVLSPWNAPPRLVNLASGMVTPLALPEDTKGMTNVAFSPDGKLLSVGDDQIFILDARTGKQVRAFPSRSGFARNLVFSPDGTRIACCCGDKANDVVVVYEVKSGRELGRLRHSECVHIIAWFADGKTFATGSYGGVDAPDTVKVWDARTLKERFTLGGTKRYGNKDADQSGYAVAVSPDGRTVVTGVSIIDNKSATSPIPGVTARKILRVDVVLRDSASGKERARLRGQPGYNVRRLAFSPNGKLLATAVDGVVRLWDPATCRQVAAVPRLVTGDIWDIAFSADGKRLGVLRAAPIEDRWGGEVQVWDVPAVLKAYGR